MTTPLSRRQFLARSSAVAAAAAASVAGVPGFSAKSYANVVGANDDVRIAVIGFNGRGNSHIDAFRKMKGVRLVALCDADQTVLDKGLKRVAGGAEKMPKKGSKESDENESGENKPREKESASQKEAAESKPGTGQAVRGYTDLRRVMDDKEIDAISTATPNHWHALITVWGCQAGKDVYVEKPVSHNVWEGRQAVAAARKYNRIVQAGTQSRSNMGLKEAFAWLQAGGLGKIKVARGLCYKRRGTIGDVDQPQQPPKSVNYDLWSGPAAILPIERKSFHYDWHWQWPYGNGDLGNQGIHQMDIARWALGKNELSPRVLSVGGRFGYADDGETPNTQMVVHDYGDSMLIFEVRGLPKEGGAGLMDKYKGQSIGVVVECEDGYVAGNTAYGKDGEKIKSFSGRKEDAGRGDHFTNFINAVRSRKVEDLNADILEGHLSSALCHTGNISHRLGERVPAREIESALSTNNAALETFERFREHLQANGVSLADKPAVLGAFLQMDPKAERFVGEHAEKANALLTRPYREPFVVPEV